MCSSDLYCCPLSNQEGGGTDGGKSDGKEAGDWDITYAMVFGFGHKSCAGL